MGSVPAQDASVLTPYRLIIISSLQFNPPLQQETARPSALVSAPLTLLNL